MHQLHRQKLLHLFSQAGNAVAWLRGGVVQHGYDTDRELDFKQESNFLYLTGITEPDFAMLMDFESGEYILVLPRRDATYATWYGAVFPPQFYMEEFEPDHVIYNDEVAAWLAKRNPSTVFCYDKPQAAEIDAMGLPTESEALKSALIDCRVIKSEFELDLLRHASWVASEAHVALIQAVHPEMNESEARALFLYHCQLGGQRHEPYVGILAGGEHAAILHYIKNDRPLRNGDLFLIDAGMEYHGYVADITRTIPVNGRFSPVQKELYQIVLDMQISAIQAAKPGVKMEDLHYLASRVALEGLRTMGLVKGEITDMMENNVFAVFFPHGLGHFLGLDTHDVGGYPKGIDRIQRPGIQYLRVRRTLEPGMVLTIEPGLYFVRALLEPAYSDTKLAQFLNPDVIEPLVCQGGIRIEDNVIITENGVENMTHVPKSIEAIEDLMIG